MGGGRAGFTLIELLVVIAILAVLMAVLLAAVMKVWTKMDELRTVNDISGMATACELFKGEFKEYPPSRILLIERPTQNCFYMKGDPFHEESVATLRRIFKGIKLSLLDPMDPIDAATILTLPPSSNIPGVPPSGPPTAPVLAPPPHDWAHNWNGAMALDPIIIGAQIPAFEDVPFVLQGSECLVFFLGGIPVWEDALTAARPIATKGFNKNMADPTRDSSNRVGPFWEKFHGDRLVIENSTPITPGPAMPPMGMANSFPVFKDRYGKPYAYFAAGPGVFNNYTYREPPPMMAPSPVTGAPPPTLHTYFYYSDSSTTCGNQFRPYMIYHKVNPTGQMIVDPVSGMTIPEFKEEIKYWEGSRFQIVSAGPDQDFGTCEAVAPPVPAPIVFQKNVYDKGNVTALKLPHQDNITNFAAGFLKYGK
jgi:prepilin-type N-terminal cleavage/methylation domain-containing protein